MYGTTANTADSGSTLTLEKLHESMRKIEEIARAAPPPVRIIESVYATKDGGRVRTYPRRKAKSESHWRRMDKKWRKRYGFHRVPCAYWVDAPAWGWPPCSRYLVVHPSIAAKLRLQLTEFGSDK